MKRSISNSNDVDKPVRRRKHRSKPNGNDVEDTPVPPADDTTAPTSPTSQPDISDVTSVTSMASGGTAGSSTHRRRRRRTAKSSGNTDIANMDDVKEVVLPDFTSGDSESTERKHRRRRHRRPTDGVTDTAADGASGNPNATPVTTSDVMPDVMSATTPLTNGISHADTCGDFIVSVIDPEIVAAKKRYEAELAELDSMLHKPIAKRKANATEFVVTVEEEEVIDPEPVGITNDLSWINTELDSLKKEPIVYRERPQRIPGRTKKSMKVPMTPFPIEQLQRNSIHREKLHVKYVVISAEYMFNKLFKQCVKTQLDILGYDDAEYKMDLEKWLSSRRIRKKTPKPTKYRGSYMYTNNYVIFVDTVFRMVTLFDRYMKNMKDVFGYENIVLIDDISWSSIPRPRPMWNFLTKTYCMRDKTAKLMMQQLRYLTLALPDIELEELIPFDNYLMRTFPEIYYVDMFHPKGKMKGMTTEGKFEARRRFLYLASLLQMQLSMKEVYLVWTEVFDILARRKRITTFTMVEQWGKHNRPHLIIDRVNTVHNKFRKGEWVGMTNTMDTKVNNITTMNELSDWKRFKGVLTGTKDDKSASRRTTNNAAHLAVQNIAKRSASAGARGSSRSGSTGGHNSNSGANTGGNGNGGIRSTDSMFSKTVNTWGIGGGSTNGTTNGTSSSNNGVYVRESNTGTITVDLDGTVTITPKPRQRGPNRYELWQEHVYTGVLANPDKLKRKKPNKLYTDYKPTSDVFDFNIIHIFNKENCVFITRKCVPYDHIFYYDFHKVYYPITCRKYVNCELDETVRLTKYVQHKRTLLSYFDDTNKECAEYMLDLNDGLYQMLFDDLDSLYKKDTVGKDVIRPDKYMEYDTSYVTYDMMAQLMGPLIARFNKKFKTEVL